MKKVISIFPTRVDREYADFINTLGPVELATELMQFNHMKKAYSKINLGLLRMGIPLFTLLYARTEYSPELRELYKSYLDILNKEADKYHFRGEVGPIPPPPPTKPINTQDSGGDAA